MHNLYMYIYFNTQIVRENSEPFLDWSANEPKLE